MSFDFNNLKNIIELAPALIVYIAPGYIVLWVKSFILSENINNDKYVILKSIVLSYVIVNFEKTIIFNNFDYNNMDTLDSCFIVITVLIAMLIGYLIPKIMLSNAFCNILKKIGINKSMQPNVWCDIADLEFGVWIRVYINSEKVIYDGKLRKFEEPDEDKDYYISLSNYSSYSYTGDDMENNRLDSDKWVVINAKSINRFEVFYNEKSKKIKN